MKFRLKDLKNVDKKWQAYALAGCVCILFYVILTHLGTLWGIIRGIGTIMAPAFIGFIIAYIVNPIAVWFNDKVFKKIKKDHVKWKLSAAVALLLVVCILALLMLMLVPQILESVMSLAENYSSYVDRFTKFLANGPFGNLEVVQNLIGFISVEGGLVSKIGQFLSENVSAIIQKASSIGTTAANWFVGAIFAIYFLLAKKSIADGISKAFALILSPLKFERLKVLTEKFNAIFSKFISCELIDALTVGVVNYIFMLIFKLPDALFVSVVVGVTNLAPTFGPVIGAVIGSFILLLVDPVAVIPFLIFTFILQTFDGYIYKPKLFGDALNVPGFLILMAIIVFGKLMGIPGILISIPVAAILVYIYNEAFIPWLELRRDLKDYNKTVNK